MSTGGRINATDAMDMSPPYAQLWALGCMVFAASGVLNADRFEDTEVDTLYTRRMGATKQRDRDLAVRLSLEILRREAESARVSRRSKSHERAVLALISLLRSAAHATYRRRLAAKSLAQDLLNGIQTPPAWAKRYVENAPPSVDPAALRDLTGMTPTEWKTFTSLIGEAGSLSRTPTVDQIAAAEHAALDLNAAARLARLAQVESSVQHAEVPVYDSSERSLRITGVSVSGFRGATKSLAVDFTRGGQPVDVLLWGDNAVGKSTIIDGIEFALQRRLDRSSDFNSSMRPSLHNLSTEEASAVVELSDGSAESRSLVTNSAGRYEPSHHDVRPGFRIAPVAIRRSDILRFLDSDALSRGTVFFDYFPDPEGMLGERPDEELKTLQEERFLLFVARSDLSSRLASLYPEVRIDFYKAAALQEFVDELLLSVDPQNELGIDALPAETRELIAQLRETQSRLSEIKRRLGKGVQTLNPQAYRSQLERVVPVLQSLGSELTSSFLQITRASHVVALDVLVAKSGPVSLDVVVRFKNGSAALPQQVFSEGYKDLIALLFFLAVTRRASELGQARVLILDDAMQSVDASVRVGFMKYVLENFGDWQIIVTGHDRAWLSQVRGLFARKGRPALETMITQWSFTGGPRLSGSARTRADSVRAALSDSDERLTAAGAGLLLEEVCQELSWRLAISVTRREGDRYTLGNLWPGIVKSLKGTSLQAVADDIDSRLDIRNLLGAHFNDWADSIAWSDVELLAKKVLTLYDNCYCRECLSWVIKSSKSIQCRCGERDLSLGRSLS